MRIFRKNNKIFFCWILIISFVFALGACNKKVDLDYDQEEILISGIEEQAFKIKIADLMKLDSVSEAAEAKRFNGEIVKIKATGPTLNTFLKQYNKTAEDYEVVRFLAQDGYEIAIPSAILANRDVILTYSDGNKPLPKDGEPLQVVVPGERAMYWVRMIKEIRFEKDAGAGISDQVVFLENIISTLPNMPYEDKNENGDAIKTSDLIEKYGPKNKNEVEKVYLMASDGLKKNENAETFLSAYIKYTGDGAPKYLAPHFPEGMKIHGLLNINYGSTSIYSLEEGSQSAEMLDIDGKKGIPFSHILKSLNFVQASNYKLVDSADNILILNEANMAEGAFVKNAENGWDFYYAGPNGEIKTMQNVNYVKAVK